MRTISQRGHLYDIDLDSAGELAFATFLCVRRERELLQDPLVKVQLTYGEQVELARLVPIIGLYYLDATTGNMSSICGVPVETVLSAFPPRMGGG